MLQAAKISPALGAEIRAIDFNADFDTALYEDLYQALLNNLAIFFRGTDLSPANPIRFAQRFGQIDEPHALYPHVDGHPNIVLLENDSGAPPDTNSWHTDLTFKQEQPLPLHLWPERCHRWAEIPCDPASMPPMIVCPMA